MALISPSGTAATARTHCGMVWSPEADGFYVFGGENLTSKAVSDAVYSQKVSGRVSDVGNASVAGQDASSTVLGDLHFWDRQALGG